MTIQCAAADPASGGKEEPAARNSPARNLPLAALRALAEADERRRAARDAAPPPQELGGRGGQDPTRYGDWEIKGLTSDF